MTVKLTCLDHLVLTVRDLDTTIAFYEEVLGMKADVFTGGDGTRRTALTFGSQKINLHQIGAEFEPKAASPTPGSADLCFLTDTALDVWGAHFETLGVAVILGPVARTGATGPLNSLYLRDPDGNLIEVSERA
ncbi:MAG: VOC family protein [Paracoccaceae bacterium]